MNILYTTNEGLTAKVPTSMCSVIENSKCVGDFTFYDVRQKTSLKKC